METTATRATPEDLTRSLAAGALTNGRIATEHASVPEGSRTA